MLDRQEFSMLFNSLQAGLGDPESPLWEADADLETSRCQWFICVKPIRAFAVAGINRTYWDWCHANLRGNIRCFSSDRDNKQEWWGFTDKDDLLLWLLKWG